MNEDLWTMAEQAKTRALRLRAETVRVLAAAEQTLAEASAGQLGAGRIEELIDEVAGLRRAMETRSVIEQAKGIVIGATGCDPDHAFEVLARQSQHENRKLVDVAGDLVRSKVRAPGADPSGDAPGGSTATRRGGAPPRR